MGKIVPLGRKPGRVRDGSLLAFPTDASRRPTRTGAPVRAA
jgi:hypothetical protein